MLICRKIGILSTVKVSDALAVRPTTVLKILAAESSVGSHLQHAEYSKLLADFEIRVSIGSDELKATVQSLSLGKGTSGNIKLHNFKRGPVSHGSKHHRLQGSLGAGTSPSRVFPGKKMPKRGGNRLTTIRNLAILDFFRKDKLVLLKGSVPGKTGALVKISLDSKFQPKC
jgi:50S ribosomal protein uL3